MQKFIPITTKTLTSSPTKLTFEIEPLEHGLANTVGNSLRRTILTHIPGYAVFAVKYEDVNHEFTTLPGVTEDILEINLNLRQIVFQISGDLLSAENEIETLKLAPTTAGKILAKHIVCPPNIKILNPDLYLATTNKTAKLHLEIFVTKGRGYVSREITKTWKREEGVIALDANFSPVLNAVYKTEPVKMETIEDYDKLIFTVETNQAVDPQAAIKHGIEILLGHYDQIYQSLTKQTAVEHEEIKNSWISNEVQLEAKDIKENNIEYLNLPVNVYNLLKQAGINTLGELISYTEEQIIKETHLQQEHLPALIAKLRTFGLFFKKDL